MAADIHVPIRKIAAYVPVTRETVRDAEAFGEAVSREWRRWLYPWEFPDSVRFPTVVLFPRAARLYAALKRQAT